MKGLSEYLDQLEKSDALSEWRGKIDPCACEISALLKALEDRRDDRAVMFTHVQNLHGEESIFPIITNLLTTRGRFKTALNLEGDDKADLVKKVALLQDESIEPKIVSRGDAPVKRNVRIGDQASLYMLPCARYHELDAGPYTTGMVIMRSPRGLRDREFYDATFVKGQVYGPRRTTVSLTGSHLRYLHNEYEKKGEKAPAIFCLGHHPSFELGVLALKPYGNNDYATIGSFMGEPLRLTASETWGDDFLVPADAEIIVEGEILPGEREFQNPFGEWSGYYQPKMKKPVMDITAITYRDKAVCRGIFPSHPDHSLLGSIPKEGSIYSRLRQINPHVKSVHVPFSGRGRLACYVSIAKMDRREVAVVGMNALASTGQLRMVVVVDDDIDIFNEQEVLWAILTRSRRDSISVIQNARGRGWPGSEQIIIDATYVAGDAVPIRNRIPPEALEKMSRELSDSDSLISLASQRPAR